MVEDSDRHHWALHEDHDCARCLRGFRDAIGDSEKPAAPKDGGQVIVIKVLGEKAEAMVLRAA